MYLRLLPFLLLFGLIVACANPPETTEKGAVETPPRAIDALPTTLRQALQAHGGLDVWDAYQSLEFKLQSVREGDTSLVSSLVDLKNRREHMEAANYQMGFDGDNYWFAADSIPDDHPDPIFYINLQFYFFAMPFVAADPGTNYEEMGQRIVDSTTYDVLKLTYEDGIGQAPEDQYLLYFDTESHQLKLLLYSVTYFNAENAENAENYNALWYDEWQTVDGLVVPLRAMSYNWNTENQALGNLRNTKTFFPVDFDKIAPLDAAFAPPENALIE